MTRKKIIPSIIAKNQKEFDDRFLKIGKVSKEIHLDIMDGKFVSNKSFMFDVKLPKGYRYEAHLMMKKPTNWIKKYGEKVGKVILHAESDGLDATLDILRGQKKKITISLKSETSIDVIEDERFSKLKNFLIMSVNPGKYGAKFIKSSLSKIRNIKKKYPKIVIEVDGGINEKTIGKVSKAGAYRFVIGSYLQKSDGVKKSLGELKKLIK